jgi:hypothetical protein
MIEGVGDGAIATEDVRPYLEKVVSACVDAEFAAYSALPEIKLDEVARWLAVHLSGVTDSVS